MNVKRWSLVWILVAVYACSEAGLAGPEPGPSPTQVPGWLDVLLTTPNSGDAGIMFTVAGLIDSVRFTHEGFSSAVSDSIWRFLSTGELSNGAIAQLLVPDVNNAAVYRPEIQQVAVLVTYEQRDLAGYLLQVVKP